MTLLYFIAGLLLLIGGAELLVRGASRIASALGIPSLIIGLTIVAFGTSAPELAISINGVISGQGSIALGNVIGSNIFNILFILGLSSVITPLFVSSQLLKLDVPLMIALSITVIALGWDLLLSRVDGLLLVSGLIIYLGVLIYISLKNRTDMNAVDHPDDPDLPLNWFLQGFFVVTGLLLLILGSRWFVNSAVEIALYLGMSELVIGLTIVSVGTSMPEVVTSVIAAFKGEREIAVGNVVGSNIFNLLSVLGITALISPSGIPVSEAVIGFDLPVMTVVAVACIPIFFTGGIISRWEGAVFLGYYVAYTLFLFLNATQHDLLPVFNTAIIYFAVPLTLITLLVLFLKELKRNGKQKNPY
ncbi:calcium/sodium antiporter [Balneola sp. MJW-20]|uniref:calcium/sodium antiporter n=1 Tax=Gracilimonas aurantiaca TaxID=3234185 RepID=UPI00346720B3